MFGSAFLEVVIGLSFTYWLLSLVCSALREGIESVTKSRATLLARGIRELLYDRDGTGLAKTLYEHPLVFGLFRGDYQPGGTGLGTNLPSYVPAANFTTALLDIVARGKDVAAAVAPASAKISIEGLRDSIQKLGNPPVQRALLSAIDTAQGDLAKAQANVESWYNSAMERVSGWYKRRTQAILMVLAVGVAIGFNVDSLRIARYLYQENTAREVLVASARSAARDSTRGAGDLRELDAEIQKLALPIGWGAQPPASWEEGSGSPRDWWIALGMTLGGWLVTAFAISLGAPFWFDVLSNIMMVRASHKPDDPAPERQKAPSPATV
jgi:hypothetical protein